MASKFKVKCFVTLVETIEVDTKDSSEALGGVINRAREIITNRYKNSVWGSKVSDISIANVEKSEVVYENDEVMEIFQDHIHNLEYHESSRIVAMNPPQTMTVTPQYQTAEAEDPNKTLGTLGMG